MSQANLVVPGAVFNNMPILGECVSAAIGDTIHDLKVQVKFTFDKGEELQTFNFHITGACEYNALESFIGDLHVVYGEELGHDYEFTVTVLDVTLTTE